MILYTKNTETSENVESENLATHVALCRQRKQSFDKRMSELERKQEKLEIREQELHSYILRTITTALFALISSAISLGAMLFQFFK